VYFSSPYVFFFFFFFFLHELVDVLLGQEDPSRRNCRHPLFYLYHDKKMKTFFLFLFLLYQNYNEEELKQGKRKREVLCFSNLV
jgi:uncharacterized membrane protein YhfC